MKELLFRAWLDKFLHLTFIFIRPKVRALSIYLYCQLFERIFYKEYLKQISILFSEKLENMKGYNFTIADPMYAGKNIVTDEESEKHTQTF